LILSSQRPTTSVHCRRLPVPLLADDWGLAKRSPADCGQASLSLETALQKILIVAPTLVGPSEGRACDEVRSRVKVSHRKHPLFLRTGRPSVPSLRLSFGAGRIWTNSRRPLRHAAGADELINFAISPRCCSTHTAGRKSLHRARQQRSAFAIAAADGHAESKPAPGTSISLVDLRTLRRVRKPTFGNEGKFARRFMTTSARVHESSHRKRGRVSKRSSMLHVARWAGDANLDFPERKIQLHKVAPSAEEFALIVLSPKRSEINRLAQLAVSKR